MKSIVMSIVSAFISARTLIFLYVVLYETLSVSPSGAMLENIFSKQVKNISQCTWKCICVTTMLFALTKTFDTQIKANFCSSNTVWSCLIF